jgi:membrane-bound serine protease (ClpP class)
VLVVSAAFVEVAEVGFWLWYSKRRRVQAGAETLIGRRAEVVAPCLPDGQVRLDGELWHAHCGSAGARTGEHVRVVARDGLVLEVEPE